MSVVDIATNVSCRWALSHSAKHIVFADEASLFRAPFWREIIIKMVYPSLSSSREDSGQI